MELPHLKKKKKTATEVNNREGSEKVDSWVGEDRSGRKTFHCIFAKLF